MKVVNSMDSIYNVLTTIPRSELIENIVSTQQLGATSFIHFLYFASADMNHLYTSVGSDYARELLAADYILPDGIALRLLHFARSRPDLPGWKILWHFPRYSREAIENKNGTDFTPELISALPSKTRIIIHGTTPNAIGPALEYARSHFGERVTWTHGYEEFNMRELSGTDPVLLLIGRGSPRQELWVQKNRPQLLARPNMIVITVGGLFDFWAGIESRAPEWMRNIGIEWLYRLANEPRKNIYKSLASLKFFYRLLFLRR